MLNLILHIIDHDVYLRPPLHMLHIALKIRNVPENVRKHGSRELLAKHGANTRFLLSIMYVNVRPNSTANIGFYEKLARRSPRARADAPKNTVPRTTHTDTKTHTHTHTRTNDRFIIYKTFRVNRRAL